MCRHSALPRFQVYKQDPKWYHVPDLLISKPSCYTLTQATKNSGHSGRAIYLLVVGIDCFLLGFHNLLRILRWCHQSDPWETLQTNFTVTTVDRSFLLRWIERHVWVCHTFRLVLDRGWPRLLNLHGSEEVTTGSLWRPGVIPSLPESWNIPMEIGRSLLQQSICKEVCWLSSCCITKIDNKATLALWTQKCSQLHCYRLTPRCLYNVYTFMTHESAHYCCSLSWVPLALHQGVKVEWPRVPCENVWRCTWAQGLFYHQRYFFSLNKLYTNANVFYFNKHEYIANVHVPCMCGIYCTSVHPRERDTSII